jgi:DNA polymerase III delta prime subunit
MNITKGKRHTARKVLLYGPEGIGKTSLAKQFPRPLFLDTERGTGEYEVDRVEVRAWSDIDEAFSMLAKADYGYKTVVLDTIDSAVPLLVAKVCREHNVRSLADMGFGKGHALVSDLVKALLDKCNTLVDAGIHVLFLAHSRIKRMEQPDLPEGYERYELRLPERVAGEIKTAFDAVLFANFRVTMVEDKGRMRAVGGKDRVLYAAHSTSHDAKNRCGIPDRAPFTIDSLAPLLNGAPPAKESGPTTSKEAVTESELKTPHPMDALAATLDASKLSAFLLNRGQISQGQSYRDLPEAYVRRVLDRPEEFRRCVLA